MTEPGQSVLVTPVGSRPAGPLTTVLTLAHASLPGAPLRKVVFVPTRATEELARRCRTLVTGAARGLDVHIADPAEQLETVVLGLARDPHTTVWYDTTPGRNLDAARTAYRLAPVLPEGTVRVVYAEREHLVVFGTRTALPLKGPSLPELCRLYHVRLDGAPWRNGLWRNVRLTPGREPSPQEHPLELCLAWAHGGRVYGLMVASERDHVDLLVALRERKALRELQPQILAIPTEPAVAGALLRNRIEHVELRDSGDPGALAPKRLRHLLATAPNPAEWVLSHAKRKPRSAVFDALAARCGIAPRPPPGETLHRAPRIVRTVRGRGGGTGTLVVALGADPSATLTALASHRPRRVFVVHDAEDPRVRDAAARLAGTAGGFPLDELHLVEAPLTGHTLTPQVLFGLAGRGEPVSVNVTPGSKGQGFALGAGAGTHGWAAWTLNNRNGTLAPLFDGEAPETRWTLPPLEVQAEVCSAAFRGATPFRPTAEELEGYRAFLGCLRPIVEALSARRGFSEVTDEVWKKNGIRFRTSEGPGFVHADVHGAPAPLRLAVRGQASGLEGGFWLEETFAAALLLAGATEVALNAEWDFEHERLRGSKAAELDVVAAWPGRKPAFVAASVKSGKLTKGLRRTLLEVQERTHVALGRFALPVLVRLMPWRMSLDRERMENTLRVHRVLDLGVAAMLEPDRLRELLDWAFERLTAA